MYRKVSPWNCEWWERDSWVIACGESEGGSKIDGDDDHDAADDNDRCDDDGDDRGGVGIWERTAGSRHLK